MLDSSPRNYHNVAKSDVPFGQPILNSIYNKDGKLLLKEGQCVVSERQQSILIKNGHIDNCKHPDNSQNKNQSQRILRNYLEELLVSNSLAKSNQKEIQSRIWTNYKDDDALINGTYSTLRSENLVETKEHLLDSLLYTLNLPYAKYPVKFRYSIMSLALTIQMRCISHPDALLGALQVDLGIGYSLVNSLKRTVICELVAKKAGLSELERLPLLCGALTCDMGYIDTQNELAIQTAPLTKEQLTRVKAHPVISEKRLRDEGIVDQVWLDVVRHHHERYDGSGYPDSLPNDKISLPAKIAGIADVFSAMLTTTSFRNTMTSNEVINFLFSEKNKLFDSTIVDLFIGVMGRYPTGSLVKFKNNEIGIVTGMTTNLQILKVLTLMKSDGTLSINLTETNTDEQDHKIITALPFSKYNILRSQLQKVWGGFR